MTYYDDEEENGQHQPPQGNRQPASLRAGFRADPSFSPRAGYQQPPQHPAPPADDAPDAYVQPAPYAAPAAHHPADDYVQPTAAPSYRAPAPDAYADPQAHAQHPHGGYHHGPSAQQQAQDVYYQQYEQQHGHYPVTPPRRRNLVNIAVVGAAVIVFGGVIFWAYNQGMRAGTESVAPILRADPAPTKIRPEQPGGMEVPHQDKLVYDRLNPANGGAPGEVERLLPPPETPMQRPRAAAEPPADEIMPMAEEGEGQVNNLPAEEQGYQPTQTPGVPSYAPPLPAPQQQQPRPVPPAPQPVQQQAVAPTHSQPAPQPAPASTPTHQAAPQTLVPPAPAKPVTPPPAVAQPRPNPPPVTQQATAAPAPRPVPPPPVVQPKPATPAPVASGGASVRVQVAAVDSETKATAEWQRLQRKFGGELGGLSMRTVRVELPKGIFYRIQGGPIDEARAKQICAAMAAQGAGCSIVR